MNAAFAARCVRFAARPERSLWNGSTSRRSPMSSVAEPERRRFLRRIGQWSVVAALSTQFAGVVRAFVPRVLYEPSKKFKVGKPSEYPEGVTFVPSYRL